MVVDGNATTDAFTNFLDTWSNIANLVMVFIIAGLVPFLTWINKYIKTVKDARKKAQDKHITELAQAVNKPIADQMEGILDLIKKTAEANEANTANLEKVTNALETMADKQQPLYTKIEYIDEFFKNYIHAANRDTSENKKQHRQSFKRNYNP